MKVNKKIFGLLLFVMLVCCVSAASATDINSTEDISANIIDEVIDDTAIDEVSDEEIDDAVEEDSVDDPQDRGIDKENSRPTPNYYVVNSSNVGDYFNTTTGEVLSTKFLNFTGTFNNVGFSNFVINRNIGLKFTNAVFYDVGFELSKPGLIIDGATFIINAPNGANCTAINVKDAKNAKILNNVITYTCNYANTAKYNHVIRVTDSESVEVSGNNITAYLPLKDVDYSQPYPSIYTDLVAGVAVQNSNKFRFTNNRLLVNVSRNSTGYPTLDALIIVKSQKAVIAYNTIIEIDNKTMPGNNNYLYAVDVYQCNDSTIDMNKITLESKGGSFIAGTDNGTGAAYGVQLTGGHTGITISNNNITTSNNGPNCGIYSQNYPGPTGLSIIGNRINVSGNAGLHGWSLVTGMELGDDNDYVAGNIINVINKAPYVSTHNAYGISYSQAAMRHPTFNITNNTVSVKNGTYAVFIMNGGSGSVTNNCLNTTAHCCNNAVNNNPNVVVSGNYCPLGSNCSCGCNCTSNNNIIPFKSILKSGDVLSVSAPEVLSAVNDEVLSETECIIYVGENKTENGNGSYENPFATLNLAYESISGHYDKIIINIFNGTYYLDSLLEFDANELIVQGISGEVIIRYRSQNKRLAFSLLSPTATFFINNITFNAKNYNGIQVDGAAAHYFQPFYGVGNTVTYTNCNFVDWGETHLIGPGLFNSNYINCIFSNFFSAVFYDSYGYGDYHINVKNSIFIYDYDYDTPYSFFYSDEYPTSDMITLDGVWFGENDFPYYTYSMFDDEVYNVLNKITKRYAIFTASENYIGNNQYEIIGKLTWNGTDEVADGFNPMTVKLSATTGVIQPTANLVNGTFKAVYICDSESNSVNVVLDWVEIPLSFNTVLVSVNASDISYGGDQKVNVSLSHAISGIVNLTVNNHTYEIPFANVNSVLYTIPHVLPAGTHEITAKFEDADHHVWFNTTNIIVSKVSEYNFNATVTPDKVYVGDNATVTLNITNGATGNVTVKVGENEAKTFNVNDVIVIDGFVAGDNVVNITFISDNYDTKSVVRNVFASTKPTAITAINVTATYNVAKELVITLTSNGEVLVNKTINVVVGTVNQNLTTNATGQASVNIATLVPDTYVANIAFAGDDAYAKSNATANVVVNKVATSLTAPKVTTTYNVAKSLVITLTANGKPLEGQKVTVKVGTISKTLTTNSKGQVSVDVSTLTPKTYTATITYAGDTINAKSTGTANVVVNKAAPKITAKKATFKAKAKTKKYSIVLKDNKGKAIKKAKVSLKVKGKTYKATTNAKGKATFKITKLTKKGKHNAVIKFGGNNYYKASSKKVKLTFK